MDYVYPQLAVASVRSAVGASEAKGLFDHILDAEEQRERIAGPAPPPEPTIQPAIPDAGMGAERGIVTHRVLQHLDFAVAVDDAGVASELQRLAVRGLISPEDREVLDIPSLGWFVSTPLAGAIRTAGSAYRREFRYIATEPPSYFDPPIGSTPGDQVLVRGVVDGILPSADGLEIIDFKTDAVSAEDLTERCQRYRPQMELYTRAMSRIWRRPVCACWLVFLAARRMVNLYDTAHR
jgi:ATP-dependent helicase/nuclease subunit A